MYCQLSHQPRLPTQAKLEAEIAALKASQPPSAHAAAAAVEATCRLQEALMQREKEIEGEAGLLPLDVAGLSPLAGMD